MILRLAAVFLATLTLCGCGKPRQEEDALPRPLVPPTFNKDIAPILFANCASCHRPGQVAPFSLLAFSDARPRAKAIARATQAHAMPPWLPEPNDPPFVGERRLPRDQIETLQRWADTGAAEGDAADLPGPPTWSGGWQLGKPDLVLTLPRPYVLQPGTHDVYRNVVLPVSLPANRFVRAVELRPGSDQVHHAVIRVDRAHTSRALDGADGQPGFDGMVAEDVQDPSGYFIGWAPGRGPIASPKGMPWPLERGSDLIVELHLIPGRSAAAVQPTIALFFTDVPPATHPVMLVISSKTIDIPAGKPDYVVEETYQLPVDVDVLSVYPHAHYLAKQMDVRALLPGGGTKTLIHITRWSFHWQHDYQYATPVTLPRGTTISMRYTYDNSEANRDSPRHPPVPVIWGPQSSDEMGTLGLQVVPRFSADAAMLTKSISDRQALENVAGAELWVKHGPRSAVNQAALGISYVQVGRYVEAVQHLEEALRLDSRSANAHNYLGGALLALRRGQDALVHFRRAVALSPRDEHLHFNLAKALDQTGHDAEAIQEFGRAIALNPDLPDAHQNLGAALFKQGDLPNAIAALQRAAELAPDTASVHSDLGGALAQAGRFEEAAVQLRRALEIDPGNTPARENLSLLERRLGR